MHQSKKRRTKVQWKKVLLQRKEFIFIALFILFAISIITAATSPQILSLLSLNQLVQKQPTSAASTPITSQGNSRFEPRSGVMYGMGQGITIAHQDEVNPGIQFIKNNANGRMPSLLSAYISVYSCWDIEQTLTKFDEIKSSYNTQMAPIIAIYAAGEAASIQSFIAGNYDDNLKHIGAALKKYGKPVFVRPLYELNLDGSEHGNAYLAAYGGDRQLAKSKLIYGYKHAIDKMNEGAGGELLNVAWVWHVVPKYAPPNGMGDAAYYESWFPGDRYVDWVGSSNFMTDDVAPWGEQNSLLQYAQSKGLPVMLAEATTGPAFTAGIKTADVYNSYYKYFFDLIKNPADGVKAFSYINNDWQRYDTWQGTGWRDTRIKSNPTVASAFAEALKSADFNIDASVFDVGVRPYEGDGITAGYEDIENGAQVMNVISKNKMWKFNRSSNSWTGAGNVWEFAPFNKYPTVNGLYPWDTDGITATWIRTDTSGVKYLTVISKNRFYRYNFNSGIWDVYGAMPVNTSWAAVPRDASGRWPWEGPGITGAWVDSTNTLKLVSQHTMWKQNLNTGVWDTPIQLWTNPVWAAAPRVDGQFITDGPGITAAWISNSSGKETVKIKSKDKYWELDTASSTWVLSGNYRDSGNTSVWKQMPRLRVDVATSALTNLPVCSASNRASFLQPPTQVTATCNSAGNQVTLNWPAASSATSYSVHIDNKQDAWDPECKKEAVMSGPNNKDRCQDKVAALSYQMSVEPGVAYDAWLFSQANGDKVSIDTVKTSFTCTAPTNVAPRGSIDSVNSSGLVSGWAVDDDSPATAIPVHLYLDGPYGTGTGLAAITANVATSNVGAHGFTYQLGSNLRDGRSHTIYAYGIDPSGNGNNALLSGSPKSFTWSGTAPTCTGVSLNKTTLLPSDTSVIATARGVSSTVTSMSFPTWSDVNGQDDLIWYPGVKQSNGDWQATIDLSRHTGYGSYNVHVYMDAPGYQGVWCGASSFTRNATATPTPTPTPTRSPTPTATSSTSGISIMASGTPALNSSGVLEYPQMVLTVNGTRVATWYVTSTLTAYNYTGALPSSISNLKVEYLNDPESDSNNDRNLRVDYITVRGTRYDSENVNSLGSWDSVAGCGEGFKHSEWLYCSGYFEYIKTAVTPTPTPTRTASPTPTKTPTPSSNNSQTNITIRAWGTPYESIYPTMALTINGTRVKQWSVTGSAALYQYLYNGILTASNVKVEFLNDKSGTNVNGVKEDRNLYVDYTQLNNSVYQSENTSVYSKGVWTSSNGCNEGYKQSEKLSCNGYFQY